LKCIYFYSSLAHSASLHSGENIAGIKHLGLLIPTIRLSMGIAIPCRYDLLVSGAFDSNLSLATIWAATQWTAWQLRFQPELS
jgi:hypothetical protein